MDNTTRLTVLVDADSVIYDWEPAFVDEFRADYPNLACTPAGERVVFDINAGLSEAQKIATRAIMDKPSFYSRLPLIPGAVDALHEMLESGIDVVICTSPWVPNPTCASDKMNSIERDFGPGWGARTVITSDKTRVIGDILIDDKPDVRGAVAVPTWEHIYFTQAYNAERTDHRRLDAWSQWRNVVLREPIAATPRTF